MKWTEVIEFFCLFSLYNGAVEYHWSSPDYANQAKAIGCDPYQLHSRMTLKKHSQSGNFTKLGKVANVEVCAILCCEVTSCDLALVENDDCFAVKCFDLASCEFGPSQIKSEIVTMKRFSGSDVWSSGPTDRVNSGEDQFSRQNKTRIFTKEAAVQKSSIPEITTITNENKGFIVLSNKDKVESPMDALLQKESTLLSNKQQSKKEVVKGSNRAKNVSEKIQDITEHYLKAEEKSDMTALQENETSITHKQLHHHRDLRHTIISPITIGAFTCMAVIAVSGFAMAIIKYQRERKDMKDKQTQKP